MKTLKKPSISLPTCPLKFPSPNITSLGFCSSYSLVNSSSNLCFSLRGLPACGPHADITRITCSPNANTTTVTLSLFQRTSTTFSHSFSFTKIPIPPIPELFIDHHNLCLHPKTPINRTSLLLLVSRIHPLSSSSTLRIPPHLFYKDFPRSNFQV